MTDALIYDNETALRRVERVVSGGGNAIVVSDNPAAFERPGVVPYMRVGENSLKDAFAYPRLYLESIELPDPVIDRVVERASEGARLYVRAAASLEEVGRLDVRLGLSPVMLLHKLGVLKGALIAGGVYLDNDDVDLMVQCDARLVLLPSTDIGGGCGIPNTVSYLARGLKIGLGTGNGAYATDIREELTLLKLITNGQMCSPRAISEKEGRQMLLFETDCRNGIC